MIPHRENLELLTVKRKGMKCLGSTCRWGLGGWGKFKQRWPFFRNLEYPVGSWARRLACHFLAWDSRVGLARGGDVLAEGGRIKGFTQS